MMKRIISALAALFASASLAFGTVTLLTPGSTDLPSLINTLNPVLAQLPGIAFTFQTGAITSIPAGTGGYYQVPRSVTVDNLTVSNYGTLTCSVSAVLALQNCGSSTTCASPTTVASATMATGTNSTAVAGTVTAANALIPAGNYLAWTFSSGTCTVANLQATAVAH